MKPKILEFLLFILLVACTHRQLNEFGLASDDPLKYLSSNIAFAPTDEWQNSSELGQLVANTTNLFDTKEEKAKAIAYYVANSKNYNIISIESQAKLTVLEIVNMSSGVCYDGAVLLVAMLRKAGIPARVVFTLFGRHAFAEAFINSRWVNIDPTFGYLNWDFEYSLPLYVFERLPNNESLLRVVFLGSNGYSLSYPVADKIYNQALFVAIKRKTDGYKLSCSQIVCNYTATNDSYQLVAQGLEQLRVVGDLNYTLGYYGFYTLKLPKGHYRLEYLTANKTCLAYADFELNSDYKLKKNKLLNCGDRTLFKQLITKLP